MAKWIEVTTTNRKKYLVNLEMIDAIGENKDGETVLTFAQTNEFLVVENKYEYIKNNIERLYNH